VRDPEKHKIRKQKIILIFILSFYGFFFIEKYTTVNLIPLIESLTWKQATLIFSVAGIFTLRDHIFRNNN